MRQASAESGTWERRQNDPENRWRFEEEVSADGARLRDRTRGGGHVACRVGGRVENAGDGNSEAAVSARRPGVTASGGNPRGLQSTGQRSGALSWFGGGPASARSRRQGFAGNECGGGRDQSWSGAAPAAGGTI